MINSILYVIKYKNLTSWSDKDNFLYDAELKLWKEVYRSGDKDKSEINYIYDTDNTEWKLLYNVINDKTKSLALLNLRRNGWGTRIRLTAQEILKGNELYTFWIEQNVVNKSK
jgi:hypothetical protein